jgi:hypothetical protein
MAGAAANTLHGSAMRPSLSPRWLAMKRAASCERLCFMARLAGLEPATF